jgi:pre-mRNA-splicing factor SYF1
MPTATVAAVTIESLTDLFPLTFPVPTPKTHPSLVSAADVNREEDLLRNRFSFRHWWTTIQNAKDHYRAIAKAERSNDAPEASATLLGPLASPSARDALQRLTYLYEAALGHFPGSFKLWKSYLFTRMGYVLGKLVAKKRAGGRKKFAEMKDALEEEKEDLEEWEGGLDPVIGWEEWKSLVATFERALMWHPKVRYICPYSSFRL